LEMKSHQQIFKNFPKHMCKILQGTYPDPTMKPWFAFMERRARSAFGVVELEAKDYLSLYTFPTE